MYMEIGVSCVVFHGCNSKQSRVSGRTCKLNYKQQHLIEEFSFSVRKNKLSSLKCQHLPPAPERLPLICQVEPISDTSFGELSLRHALRLPSSCTRFKNFFVPRLRQMILTTFFIRRTSLKLIIFLSLATRKLIFNAINIALQLLP